MTSLLITDPYGQELYQLYRGRVRRALKYALYLMTQVDASREKPERDHVAILHGTLLLGRTTALTGFIFELAELHGQIHVELNRPFIIASKNGFRATSTTMHYKNNN